MLVDIVEVLGLSLTITSTVIKRKIFYGNLRVLTDAQITQVKEVQINLEKLLEGHKYMAGDTLTVADYSFITLVDILEAYVPMENKFPLIKAWSTRCRTAMKNFDHVNKKGAIEIVAKIKEGLSAMAYAPMEDKFPLMKAWAARCQSEIKNFNRINRKGAEEIVNKIKEGLSLFEHFR